MREPRQALDFTATSLMLLLCFIWSLAQISLKYTAPGMVPILQIALRLTLASYAAAFPYTAPLFPALGLHTQE